MKDEEVIQALNEEIDDLYKMIEEKDKRFECLYKAYVHLADRLLKEGKDENELVCKIKSPGVYAIKEGCHILEVCTPFIDGTIIPEYMQAKKII